MPNEIKPGDGLRRSRIWPSTKLGRVSARLLAALLFVFAVALFASLAFEDSIDEGGDVFRAVIGIAFLLTAAGAALTSAIAILRDKERALVSVLALVLGLVAAAVALGDQLQG